MFYSKTYWNWLIFLNQWFGVQKGWLKFFYGAESTETAPGAGGRFNCHDWKWRTPGGGTRLQEGSRLRGRGFLSAGNLSSEFLFGEEFVCGEFVFGIRVHKGIRLRGEFVFGWNGPLEGIHLGNSPSSSDGKVLRPQRPQCRRATRAQQFSICQLGKTQW